MPVFAATVIASFLAEHDVTVVASVAAARTLLREGAYELILVDYDLDDEKGDALVRALATTHPRPRIIGVSARPEGNDALFAAGADAVCNKLRFSKVVGILS